MCVYVLMVLAQALCNTLAVNCDLKGVWQWALQRDSNWSRSHENARQYVRWPPPSVPSQAINSFPFLSHTHVKSLLTSQLLQSHAHTFINTHECWELLDHGWEFAHYFYLPDQSTPPVLSCRVTPCADEPISRFHSLHHRLTPSISPLSLMLQQHSRGRA